LWSGGSAASEVKIVTRDAFLIQLDELLELPVGTLKGDEKLEDLEHWDSLAMVSFIALADEHCNIRLSPRQFVTCNTVSDLVRLAGIAA
jgi:acyl carrier protein